MAEKLRRRRSVVVDVGGVRMGGDYPVRVQSMTNTPTADVEATVAQIRALVEAGSELVRITVNTQDAARAVPRIVGRLRDLGLSTPIIGDFHYNGHLLLTEYPECARALDKYRINPGNVGSTHRDDNFAAFIRAAVTHGKPIRIGVNWGSLDQQVLAEMMDRNARRARPRDTQAVVREAMVESALRSAELAERLGQPHDRIVLSVKMSRVADMVAVYRDLAARCDYPLHLGLTEAGMGIAAIVASAAALSILLEEGIGDTIRVSITPEPGGDRTLEVQVARAVLQALELRRFTPRVFSCPGCGRTTNTFFQELAQEVQSFLAEKMPVWREQYPGVEELQVAVMGCVVNGPGESKHADIGISLPGAFEEPKAPVYIDGKLATTLRGERIADEFKQIIEKYVATRFGNR